MSRVITNQHPLPSHNPPAPEQLLQHLRPHGSQEALTYGFLGHDENLEEVTTRDREVLQRLGLTYDQIARTIEDVFLHMPASINGHRLHLFGYIHSPECPWQDFCAVNIFDYSEQITEIWLCNPRYYWILRVLLKFWGKEKRLAKLKWLVEKDWVMVLSDLHPHLIRDHQFFEGHGTPYRIDPERFVKVLGRHNIHPYAH